MDSVADDDDDVVNDLTVAIDIDSISYDAKCKQYTITLSNVELSHLDMANNKLSIKLPQHRLHKIKTPTYNAEESYPALSVTDDENIDEITGNILNENGQHYDEKKDDKKQQQKVQNVQALNRHDVISEWTQICTKYKGILSEQQVITKNGCLSRISFMMKHYSQWISYKDKHFKSHNLPKNEDFLSITSFMHALNGYDKIKLLNDYHYMLTNILQNDKNNEDIDMNVHECEYILHRIKDQHSELYNKSKLSSSMRRDLYFINERNAYIENGSVEERVEIGIQQYLDSLYVAISHPSVISNGNKFCMNLPKNNNAKNDDFRHLFGEYLNYWKSDHAQYICPKYVDLKHELLNNAFYSIDEKDFFCLYNRSKDYLLSICGKQMNAKRVKMGCKIRLNQTMSIGHVICLLLYVNYFDDFVNGYFIKKGLIKAYYDESFSKIRIKNAEIANWCKLLNEAIFCFGFAMKGDERLYYAINRRISFKFMSSEWNIPISTTSQYGIINKIHQKNDKGIILRLGKYEKTKEYNYFIQMSVFSKFSMECEHLIFGGKYEIFDIIYGNVSHFTDLQSFKLYLAIMRGRWFSHNKLLFKKQYEKKLILFVGNFLSESSYDMSNVNDYYVQSLFNNIVLSNGSTKKYKTVYIEKNEINKCLPELRALIINKLVPTLCQKQYFKRGYNMNVMMKINYNLLNNSSFSSSLYSKEYKYELLYLKNNKPQIIVFHWRCYKKKDEKEKKDMFKGCFEIKALPECCSKVKIIGGLLLPQIGFEKWDFITLSTTKLYSGCSLFELQKIKNFDSVLVKIAFQIKEVMDTDGKVIPTIDL